MFFNKLKPSVTKEDKDWIDDSFLWFEGQYGRNYLKSVRIIEPTREFFNIEFSGKEEDAHFVLSKCLEYMDIKAVKVDLNFYSEAPIDFEEEGVFITQSEEGNELKDSYPLGTYSEASPNHFLIDLERGQLNDPHSMIATIAHELSHLILLGEGRIQENDEELTDLNCIALGFGIFISNNIFHFNQWQGASHHGWSTKRNGYLPEEVAAYAMALLSCYQNNPLNWTLHLNKTVKKMFDKNVKYLRANPVSLPFKNT